MRLLRKIIHSGLFALTDRLPENVNYVRTYCSFYCPGLILGWASETYLRLTAGLEISQESARYNIGQVKRTVNLPTIALSFLHPLNQHRFAFEKIGELSIDNRQTWAIRYHERVQPTVVQTQSGDLFAHGTLWLDVQNGKALRTHLVLGDAMSDVRTTIKVNYWHNEGIGTLVPAVMDELYENPKDASATRIEATAVYSNFRKFDVSTDVSVIEE